MSHPILGGLYVFMTLLQFVALADDDKESGEKVVVGLIATLFAFTSFFFFTGT